LYSTTRRFKSPAKKLLVMVFALWCFIAMTYNQKYIKRLSGAENFINGAVGSTLVRLINDDEKDIVQRYRKENIVDRSISDYETAGELSETDGKMKQLLVSRTAYHNSDLGYSIYSPEASAEIMMLARKKQLRLSALGFGEPLDSTNDRHLPEAWGISLNEADPEGIPEVGDVAAIIDGMPLPSGSLEGLKIFILPVSLKNTSGLSWPGVMVLGSRPKDSDSIDTQLDFTVAHEVGHILHYKLLGKPGSSMWQEYMKIRRIHVWKDGGAALTQQWEDSVEETFAEDVRVLIGSKRSSAEPHLTDYGDPRKDKKLSEKIRKFIFSSINADSSSSGEVIKSVGEYMAADVFSQAPTDLV
jgi:hypothetical protein